jgi:hypothetical protein
VSPKRQSNQDLGSTSKCRRISNQEQRVTRLPPVIVPPPVVVHAGTPSKTNASAKKEQLQSKRQQFEADLAKRIEAQGQKRSTRSRHS